MIMEGSPSKGRSIMNLKWCSSEAGSLVSRLSSLRQLLVLLLPRPLLLHEDRINHGAYDLVSPALDELLRLHHDPPGLPVDFLEGQDIPVAVPAAARRTVDANKDHLARLLALLAPDPLPAA